MIKFEKPFVLLFFDIDNFKNVNDFYGHSIGDEILKMVAKTLSNNVRSNDIIGRWGGEEFIGIISCDNKEILFNVAEKLRILVQKSYYKIVESDDINVTVSIGGTMINKKDDVVSLINRADQLMYASKSKGKNQVHVE